MSDHPVSLPVPILIVEDDAIMQKRLSDILLAIGYQTNALFFADTLTTALTHLKQQTIAFALVDLGLPDGNGTTFIKALRQRAPNSLILVISAWSTQDAILSAIQAGATGYILKERDDFEITLSIRNLLRGGAPIDPFIAQQILNKIVQPRQQNQISLTTNHPLSTRELEILQLVAQGLSNKEIAEHLHLSRYTVECHIKNIYRKLCVGNRSKAISIARNLGLLS